MRFWFLLACSYLAAVSPLRVPAFNRPLRVARLHVTPATVATATTNAEVVVVGGGPGGLAYALELRCRLPQTSVVVIERQSSLNAFDPERAFLYLIDGRGQKFTDAHNLTDKVRARGVSFDGNSGFNVTVCPPNAPRKEVSLQLVDRQRKTPYWIARNEFVEVLADAVTEDPGIVVLAGHACQGLRRQPGGGFLLEAAPISSSQGGREGRQGGHEAAVARRGDEANDTEGREHAGGIWLQPRLVIAADGARSQLRTTLDAWAQADADAAAAKASTSRQNKQELLQGDRFALKVRPSPSGGLRYKVLSLPGGFPLDKASPGSSGGGGEDSDSSGGSSSSGSGGGGGGEDSNVGMSAAGATSTSIPPPPLSSSASSSSSPSSAPSLPSSAKVSLYDASAIAARASPPPSPLSSSSSSPPPPSSSSSQPSSPSIVAERAQPRVTYSFRSKFQSLRRRACRLGLLPRPSMIDARTANLITPPDHVVWTDPHLRTPEGMADFLEESFPQLALKEAYGSDDAVLKEEISRFARSPGGTFPEPSTTRGGVVYTWQPSFSSQETSETSSSLVSTSATNSSTTAADILSTTTTATVATITNISGPSYVALIGDALHFFPPDVGQGVNSALEEALVLGKYLQEQQPLTLEADEEQLSLPATDAGAVIAEAAGAGAGAAGAGVQEGASPKNECVKVNWQRLGQALAQYESRGRREAAALVRIVQVANPYQYSQPGRIAKLRQTAWGLNFVLRRLLAKIPLLGAESAFLRRPAPPSSSSSSSLSSEAPPSLLPPWWVLFHEALFVLVQRGDKVSYFDALKRANKTTTVLWTAALGAMLLGARCSCV